MHHSARVALSAGILFLVTLAIYLHALDGPLFFDDIAALSVNDLVQIDGTRVDEWRTAALSSNSGPLRRPISMLSFAANHVASSGFSPAGLKATNLAIHLFLAAVLYFLFYAILEALNIGSKPLTRNMVAVTAAAIWLLHPLHVSTVLYAVQRMAQLATLFVALGLLVFMRYRQRWAVAGCSAGELLAAVMWLLLLTALAALSKENGLLLPWLIVVLEVCIFRGVWAGRSSDWLRSLGWVALFLPVALVLSVLVVSPDVLIEGYSRREFTLQERLLTQGRVLWHYLSWICLPNISDMAFQHDDVAVSQGFIQPFSTAIALLVWCSVVALAFVFRRRYPLLLLAVLFYLVAHSLESSVIPLEMVYEHRNYLPSTMVCLGLAALLVVPAVSGGRVNPAYPVLGALVILVLLLFVRVQLWSDEVSLFRSDVANHAESSRSNYLYANALLRDYRQREALGLGEQEAADTLGLSRHYFERMYQTNQRDIAALVMLYYLDSAFFPELQQHDNWIHKLEVLLETRTLQASDWNALDTLFNCIIEGPCEASNQRLSALLDLLEERYPESGRVLLYRYRSLAASDVAPERLVGVLQQARQLAPGSSWVYYHLIYEHGRANSPAGMYENARAWLINDHRRHNTHSIKALFGDASVGEGSGDE